MNRFMASIFVATALALAGCGGQADPVTGSGAGAPAGPEALIFLADDTDGSVTVVEHGAGGNSVMNIIPVASANIGDMVVSSEGHLFVNATDNSQVAAIDPLVAGPPEFRNFLPVGNRPVHAERDPEGTRVWVMNDGNATTAPCATSGPGNTAMSSVSVIQNHAEDEDGPGGRPVRLGEVIKTICVGKGHHKATFSEPSAAHPNVPRRVFVSHITDGTISVIENNLDTPACDDPASSACLPVIATIDLCDSAKEALLGNLPCDADLNTPNKSGPHGNEYSPSSGKVYNINPGYGTVSVIDPETNAIEATIDVGIGLVSSSTISPDGATFLIRATDTVSDPDHVIGKITLINTEDNSLTQISIPDVYHAGSEFTPDGQRLYVSSATRVGKITDPNDATKKIDDPEQLANLKNTVMLVFDTPFLPESTPKEITVGKAGKSSRAFAFQEHDGAAEHVWVLNPTDGTMSVLDSESDTVVDTVVIGGEPSSLVVMSLADFPVAP